MNKFFTNSYIRSFFALLLIIIFALSNTPKQQLHNLFAGHTDISTNHKSSELNFSKAEFHCQCDNLVVIAPFLGSSYYTLPSAVKYFSTFVSAKKSELPLYQKIYFELRGPPATA
ncbi:MAG: hypothetical protein ABIP68_00930 [Ferruginibacter sp.]